MKKEDLKQWGFIDEEKLSLLDRLKLARMTKGRVEEHIFKLFNREPQFLRDYQKVYFAKYLSDNYSFYADENDNIYTAPAFSTPEQLQEYFVPSNCERKITADIFKENGIGYKNLRVYSVVPGIKYKLIKGHSLTGMPSFDRPWAIESENYEFKYNDLLDFFEAGRSKLLSSEQAFQCYDQKMSWTKFKEKVNDYMRALAANNITEGDKIAVCTQSIIEPVALFFAAYKLGAATMYIDPDNTNIHNINKYLNTFNSKVLFTTPQYVNSIKEAKKDTNVQKLVVLTPGEELKKIADLSEYSKEYLQKIDIPYMRDDTIISEMDFINQGKEYNGTIKKCANNNNLALLTSTSGTTGNPKIVRLTGKNIMAEMMYLKRSTHLELGPQGINMQVVPFKYPYGFVISTLLTIYGGKTSGLCPDITPSNYLKFIKMYKPTYIHAIPSFFKNMFEDSEVDDLSFVKHAVSGGDFYDSQSIKAANEAFKRHNSTAQIKNGFGSAEGTGCVTAQTFGKYNFESVGKPLTGITVKIVDKDGKELPYDHIGNIRFTGGNVMFGYDGDEKNTADVKITEDGKEWILSDAIGFMDREGFLYICDRERNLFITYSDTGSPFKVYPNYIKNVINEVDGVEESIVVKAPDDNRILVPYAFVSIKDGYDSNEVMQKVRQKCELELDKCAIPVNYEIVNEIKVKESGKEDVNYYENTASSWNEDRDKEVKKI